MESKVQSITVHPERTLKSIRHTNSRRSKMKLSNHPNQLQNDLRPKKSLRTAHKGIQLFLAIRYFLTSFFHIVDMLITIFELYAGCFFECTTMPIYRAPTKITSISPSRRRDEQLHRWLRRVILPQWWVYYLMWPVLTGNAIRWPHKIGNFY